MGKSALQSTREKLLKGLTVNGAVKAGEGLFPDVPEWVEAFPVLNALFVTNTIDDKPRKLPTLTLWMEDNGIKVVLSDRATHRKMWATAPSLGGVWGELEVKLTSAEPDWRSDAGTKVKSRA